MERIQRIELKLPMRMGTVNAYLVEAVPGFVLVDTGPSRALGDLEWALEDAGVGAKDLRAIVITHGDFDHIGNVAALRQTYGCTVAMHPGDAKMARSGEMFAGRATQPKALVRAMTPRVMRFGKECRFKPDVLLDDGKYLKRFDLDARVLHLPGHSAGSIGILVGRDLICGDLLENVKGPALGSIVDDAEQHAQSVARVRGLPIRTVYPGHGEPFPASELPEDAP